MKGGEEEGGLRDECEGHKDNTRGRWVDAGKGAGLEWWEWGQGGKWRPEYMNNNKEFIDNV